MMLGMVWILRFGMVSFGVFCFCRVRYGTDSLARRGMLRFGLLGFGEDFAEWLVSARSGMDSMVRCI